MKRPNRFNHTAGEGALLLDSEGRVLSLSRVGEEILGVRAREVIGRPCHEVIHGRDPAGNLFCFSGCSVMTMARQGETAKNFNLQAATPRGEKVWLNTSTLLESTPSIPGRPHILHLFRRIPPPVERESGFERTGSISGMTFELVEGAPKITVRPRGLPLLVKKYSLTKREGEVLALLVQGLVAKEIAAQISLSTSTVRSHIQRILSKLQVHSKLEAILLVLTASLGQGKSR